LWGWSVFFGRSVCAAISQRGSPDGVTHGRGGSLLGYRYESYDAADMQKHLDSYLTTRPDWAILDHDKTGRDKAATARSAERSRSWGA